MEPLDGAIVERQLAVLEEATERALLVGEVLGADPAATVVSSGLVLPFLVLAVVGMVPLWLLLRVDGEVAPAPPVPPGRRLSV